MRLSGYMTCPNKPIFQALRQTMAYLNHHPNKPIMYSSRPLLETTLECHFSKGDTEITGQYKSFLKNFNDSDLG